MPEGGSKGAEGVDPKRKTGDWVLRPRHSDRDSPGDFFDFKKEEYEEIFLLAEGEDW